MKEWLSGYLSFSRKERMGVIALLTLIILVWLLPVYFSKPERLSHEILERADSLQLGMLEAPLGQGEQAGKSFNVFPFDPNRISDTAWIAFGIKARTIATIRKYLERGGRFRQASDLYKIYGMRKEEAERLMPFVRIGRGARQMSGNFDHQSGRSGYGSPWRDKTDNQGERSSDGLPGSRGRSSDQSRSSYTPFTRGPRVPVDINSADSALFESLPGIGAKLASRIIRFRNGCGGFYSIDQVAGIYGISDSLFMVIKPLLKLEQPSFAKININDWDADSLASHPYIQKHEARAIVNFRKQHGRFNGPEDLSRISILSPEWVERIRYYLAFQ